MSANLPIVILTLAAAEKSTYYIDEIEFKDVTGAVITPNTDTVKWCFTDKNGAVQNEKENQVRVKGYKDVTSNAIEIFNKISSEEKKKLWGEKMNKKIEEFMKDERFQKISEDLGVAESDSESEGEECYSDGDGEGEDIFLSLDSDDEDM